MGGSFFWDFFISGIHFSLMFMNEEGETTEKQRRNTSVLGYTKGRRVSKSS